MTARQSASIRALATLRQSVGAFASGAVSSRAGPACPPVAACAAASAVSFMVPSSTSLFIGTPFSELAICWRCCVSCSAMWKTASEVLSALVRHAGRPPASQATRRPPHSGNALPCEAIALPRYACRGSAARASPPLGRSRAAPHPRPRRGDHLGRIGTGAIHHVRGRAANFCHPQALPRLAVARNRDHVRLRRLRASAALLYASMTKSTRPYSPSGPADRFPR